MYQCNNKFQKGKDKCLTPHLTEDEIKAKFIEAYNITMKDKKRIIKDLEEVINLLTNTTELDNNIDKINEELSVVVELASKVIKENSKSSSETEDYGKIYEQLVERHEILKSDLEKLLKEKPEKAGKAVRLNSFLSLLRKAESELNE